MAHVKTSDGYDVKIPNQGQVTYNTVAGSAGLASFLGLNAGNILNGGLFGNRCGNGWNGKGMFLWLKPATEVRAEWCKDPLLKALAEENGGSIAALGTICMYTHDASGRKAILTGWLASQSDMLLEDWIIVE